MKASKFKLAALSVVPFLLAGCAPGGTETPSSILTRLESAGITCEPDIDEMLSKTNDYGTTVIECGDGAGGGTYLVMVNPSGEKKFTSTSVFSSSATYCTDQPVTYGENWFIESSSVVYSIDEIASALGTQVKPFKETFSCE